MSSPQEKISTILQLFAELGNQDERRVEDAYYMLKDFLTKEGNSQYIVAKEVVPFLHIGLQHPDPLIRTLTVDQLAISINLVPNSISLLRDNNLVAVVAKTLGDDYSVAKPAEKFFLMLAKHADGASLIFDENVQNVLLQHMKDETNQLRVMDMFADISQISKDYFLRVQTLFLDPVVQAFRTTSDVLRRLNFVEIIIKISTTRWGLEYVRDSGLLQSFYNVLVDFNTSKTSSASKISRSDSFLTNKLIAFIGQAARDPASVSIILQLPFLDIISQHLEEFFSRSSNYFKENTEVAITAVGDIGQSKEGLDLLFSHSNILSNYIGIMQTEDSSILIPTFHSFGSLFASDNDTQKLESIYKQLPTPFMRHVMKYVNKPFEDLRYSVYHFIQGLTHHQWGVVALLTHPGFFEWLTNRTTEVAKQGKEWKYSIVQGLLDHKDAVETTLGGEKVSELKMYLTRGIFFLPTEAALEVATKV